MRAGGGEFERREQFVDRGESVRPLMSASAPPSAPGATTAELEQLQHLDGFRRRRDVDDRAVDLEDSASSHGVYIRKLDVPVVRAFSRQFAALLSFREAKRIFFGFHGVQKADARS